MAWIIEMPLSVRALYAELPWNSFGEFAAALCSHDDAITAFSDIVIVIGNEEIHTLAMRYFPCATRHCAPKSSERTT